jgi:hypothetical protein
MDFLDPRRRRSHRRRLFIGYALMSIMIAIGTMIILYLAYGYDIDRKTGGLIQNGIVFVDSKPSGATIYLNDVRQGSRTDTRMVLPAGTYTVRLEADGYRNWERTINLEGGQIQQLVYPFFLPTILKTTDVSVYDTLPSLATQSPDRRWVLVQKPGQTYQFDVFDLNDPNKAPLVMTIPPAVLSVPGAASSLEIVEWSTDNRHVLIKRTYDQDTEYIMLDREDTAETININKVLGITPVFITLRDKKADQFYYLDAVPGVLRSANTANKTLSAPLASDVLAYKAYADDVIVYATQAGAEAGKTDFKIIERDKVYALKSVNQSDSYFMDVARYDSEWYYVVGGSKDNMVFVYENPVPSLKQGSKTPLIIAAILRFEDPRFVSFSANAQYISLQNGTKFLTVDLEDRRQYRFTLEHAIDSATKVAWMDGHRFVFTVNNQSHIIEFDGSNEETLVTSELTPGPFFDRNYDNVFTFEPSKQVSTKKAFTFTQIDQNQ